MIADDRQHRTTRDTIDKFEWALGTPEPRTDDPDSLVLRRAAREGMESFVQDLREQAADYEALQDGATS